MANYLYFAVTFGDKSSILRYMRYIRYMRVCVLRMRLYIASSFETVETVTRKLNMAEEGRMNDYFK